MCVCCPKYARDFFPTSRPDRGIKFGMKNPKTRKFHFGGFGTFSRIALIGIIFSCQGFLGSVKKEDDINVCPTPVGEGGEGCILYVIAKKWYIISEEIVAFITK